MPRGERRELRHGVLVHADSRDDSGMVQGGTIDELSASGCRISPGREGIEVGSLLTVTAGTARSISGCVKWCTGEAYGLEFDRPLHKAELDHLRFFLNEHPVWTET